MINDNGGKEIKIGSVLFYSERPYSNYADSIVHVYEEDGADKVETLVFNADGAYVAHHRDPANDLNLDSYSLDVFLKPTDTCDDLALLDGVSKDDVTVEMASSRFPLDAE